MRQLKEIVPPECWRDKWIEASELFQQEDRKGALAILKELADRGVYGAYFEMGRIYEQGKGGVTKDLKRAKACYETLLDLGDIGARIALVRMYLDIHNSYGDMRDYSKAMELLTPIQSLEEPGALYALGLIYEHGWGVQSDRSEAIHYYERSSDAEHVLALMRLGFLLMKQPSTFFRGVKLWAKGYCRHARIVWELHGSNEDRRLGIYW